MASAYSSSSSVSAQTIGGTSSWTEKSSIWDCGPDVGHRQAGNPNVLAQYLMTNIFKMVSWKKVLHALEADSFIHVHVHTYLIYILNSNCTWIAANKPFGIVTEHLLLFISTTGSIVFKLNSAPKQHANKVKDVQQQVSFSFSLNLCNSWVYSQCIITSQYLHIKLRGGENWYMAKIGLTYAS